MREREDANRTREAGNLDEIQGVVANTLNLQRNGAAKPRVLRFTLVGFIDWLDGMVIPLWISRQLSERSHVLSGDCEQEQNAQTHSANEDDVRKDQPV